MFKFFVVLVDLIYNLYFLEKISLKAKAIKNAP